jgi:hypothetical protein
MSIEKLHSPLEAGDSNVSTNEALDADLYASFEKLFFEDYEYLGGRAKVREKQKKSFCENEIENPTLDYPSLEDFNFETVLIEDSGNIGKILKSRANSGPTLNNFVGFVKNSVSSGATNSIVSFGTFNGLSSLTVGKTYYISDTAGAVSSTAGTISKSIGLSVSSTSILINY